MDEPSGVRGWPPHEKRVEDIMRTADKLMQGVKHDKGKLDWTLLPFRQVAHVVNALGYGERKYSRDNWKRVDQPRTRYLAAAFRHLVARLCGEKRDPESGEYHLAQAVCNLLFVMYFDDEEMDEGKTKYDR